MDEFLFDLGEDSGGRVKDEYRPRPYQSEADDRSHNRLTVEDAPATAMYVATGLGKTEIASLLIQRTDWPKQGRVFLTPRRELVVQSAERLRSRGVACCVEMAEQRSYADVTVGCYASFLSRDRYERYLGTTGLLIVDESHLNYTPTAIAMINRFKEWGAKVVGMTATPNTGKKSNLFKTYGEPAFVYDYLDACRDGWLVPAKIYMTLMEDLDLSAWREGIVGGRGQDVTMDGKPTTNFAVGEFMKRKTSVTTVCEMVRQYYEGLPSVVFAMTIEQAEDIQKELLARNIKSSVVHSKMSDHERRQHLGWFETGVTDVVVNVGVLTLGWDSPRVRKIFIARPTKSQARYIQMFGRGTRAVPGLVDRYGTAEERRQAIAESDKPFMEVFDLTDSSRNNDLCSAMDVLYPKLDPRLLMRVRTRVTSGATTAKEIDPILAEESAALAAEDQHRRQLEWERNQHLTGSAQFTAYERDVTAVAEDSGRGKKRDYWWMPFGKYKGRGFSKIPRGYLEALLPHVKQKDLAHNIAVHLRGRKD